MGPDVVTARVLRLCLDVRPSATTGNHLPFLLLLHLVMVMRNLASPHSEQETSELSDYLSAKAQGMKKVDQAGRWLADAMGVSATALDIRSRITVRHWPGIECDGTAVLQGGVRFHVAAMYVWFTTMKLTELFCEP